jgi:hypothetical protein
LRDAQISAIKISGVPTCIRRGRFFVNFTSGRLDACP